MLDEKDLQAIAQLMHQQKQEIIHEVTALIEADVKPKFDLLADGIQLINEKMVSSEVMEDMDDRIDILEDAVQLHTKEIARLKKAQ